LLLKRLKVKPFVAQNGLSCSDVQLRNYSELLGTKIDLELNFYFSLLVIC